MLKKRSRIMSKQQEYNNGYEIIQKYKKEHSVKETRDLLKFLDTRKLDQSEVKNQIDNPTI